jgi:hypothetical protein
MICDQDPFFMDRVRMILCAMTIVLAGDTEALDWVTMILWAVTIVLAGDAEALD